MNKTILSIFALSTIILSGCSTKQYPQSAPVSITEINIMDCKDVKLEIAKMEAVNREIEETGRFDGRTVLGFLGDFGIGNGLAKEEARKKAQDRMWRLQSLKESKCKNENL